MHESVNAALPKETWLTESLDTGFSYSIRSSQLLSKFRSAYQDIEVHHTESFGHLLRLDGSFMASEKDEFFYHENLVHVAACAHPLPQTALIIGGGDGGAAEEILKHSSITSVIMVEIDEAVIKVARQYLQGVHHGVIDAVAGDPRLTILIEDGFRFIQEDTAFYDLIILDLTDPGGPSETLYTAAFYQACARRLKAGGALCLHIASPFSQEALVINTVSRLQQAFAIVRPYLVTVPLSGGPWMMACASNSLDPLKTPVQEIDACIACRGLWGLQFYNGATHQAVMALPNFVRSAIDRSIANA